MRPLAGDVLRGDTREARVTGDPRMAQRRSGAMTRFDCRKWGSRLVLAAGVLGVSPVVAGPARAHTDPSGRTDTGVGASMRAFRADNVTPIGDGTVTECEMIVYQATLNPQPAAVAFES